MNIRSSRAILATLMLAAALPAFAAIDSNTNGLVDKVAYLNASQDSAGTVSFTCFGDCDAKGNMDFSATTSPVRVTFTVSSPTLDVSFCLKPGQTVMLARKSDIPPGTCPTAPTPLPTFHGYGAPHGKSDIVQFTDDNNDHTAWVYGLKICQKKDDGSTVTVTFDPQIINH
jgi:hypothetical protein